MDVHSTNSRLPGLSKIHGRRAAGGGWRAAGGGWRAGARPIGRAGGRAGRRAGGRAGRRAASGQAAVRAGRRVGGRAGGGRWVWRGQGMRVAAWRPAAAAVTK
ncbi:hypothetical protein Ani05nite_47710 [Amorphoplanes nipponensis]|uniref:Uncharacterized protein n=1 Tax=Actinoplanes nipponensis TaxID=135950 RepID=A0A919JLA3_9ACTN|nr:hypothetical protein Ani05nite_47710 [Actinoplanes nipponensis]